MKIETIQHRFPLELVAKKGRIGVIALGTDINVEQDLRRMYPPGVEIFTSRVRNYNPLTIDNLRRMTQGIGATAETILPGTKMDAMIFACTSGAVAIGVEKLQDMIQQVHPQVPVTNPFSAALAGFKHLNIKKISILTPYTEGVNKEVVETFESQGIEVVNIAGFGFEDDTEMSFISPEDVKLAAIDTFDTQADALFLSCTALRASTVIEDIEKVISKPVISSNQALVWHSLQLIKHPEAITNYGQLLAACEETA